MAESKDLEKIRRKLEVFSHRADIIPIAKEIFCGPTPNAKEKFTIKDTVLLFLGAAVTVAVFLMPRTPDSVVAGTIILLILLIHPVIYAPYVLGKSEIGRIRRRIIALILTVLIVGTGGCFAWREAVTEVMEEVHTNLTASVSIYPDNVYASMFSFTNDSGHDVMSTGITCWINEGYPKSGSVLTDVGFPDNSSVLIKAGKDSRSTECFRPMLHGAFAQVGGAGILCADVTLSMDYSLAEFPYSKGNKQSRFLIRSTSNGYDWSPQNVSGTKGFCTGRELF